MTIKNFALAAGTLALGLASMLSTGNAQGPLYDQVNVSLPYSVTIGDRTLQPGDYWIRQLPSPGGASRVLLIYSNSGMKFETSALTIPALDNRTPEDTKIMLHHFGRDYYFDKIWIQGKNYGYEFPLPDSVKARERERMEPASVAARYEAVPDKTETAQAAAPAPQPEPAPEPAPAPAPAPAEPTTTAQNTTPAPAPEPAPAPAETPAAAAPDTSADRQMPATAGNWLSMLLGGGLLSGAGLVLRRKR